jgi:hypothetical protein
LYRYKLYYGPIPAKFWHHVAPKDIVYHHPI